MPAHRYPMSLSILTLCPRPGRRLLAVACGGLLAAAAQAASVQAPTDPLQHQDAAAPTTAGKTLDRALSVDTNTGQRNLDLLLESRTAGEVLDGGAPQRAGEPPARRATVLLPQAQAPAGTGTGTSSGTDLPAAAAPTTTSGIALPAGPSGQATTGSPGLPGTAMQREWLGAAPGGAVDNSGLPAAAGGLLSGGADLGLNRAGNDAAREIDPALRGAIVRDAVQFLRDNRHWLLGALALVAGVLAGVQLYLRRKTDTPEHRAEQLAQRQAERHSQRRTRRRSEPRA